MELVRELLRDFVGIIIPGSLLVIFSLCLFWGIAILVPFDSSGGLSIGGNSVSFFVLLVFSYIAGQSLRMKRLHDLERACTETYRKKHKAGLSDEDFEASIERIKQQEQEYYADGSNLDKLTAAYKQHNKQFEFWEMFPYPYLVRGRRLYRHPRNYNQFYEKYDKQGITKDDRFFNFCKSVAYEYSPSLKEELLRQEALVRLFAGVYYTIKYGNVVAAILGVLHLLTVELVIVLTIASRFFLGASVPSHLNLALSGGMLVVSIFALLVFWYLNREILDRLRYMRSKEINLVYDGFYLICTRHDLDL